MKCCYSEDPDMPTVEAAGAHQHRYCQSVKFAARFVTRHSLVQLCLYKGFVIGGN